MSEIGRLIRAIRRSVRVRDRTFPVGTVRYRCRQCAISIKVTLARGVALPSRHGVNDLRAPAPTTIPCGFCGDQLEIDESTYKQEDGIELLRPYLRVPSQRAGVDMMARGVVEAQVVRDDLEFEHEQR